jgi:predicted transcriptional regulator
MVAEQQVIKVTLESSMDQLECALSPSILDLIQTIEQSF